MESFSHMESQPLAPWSGQAQGAPSDISERESVPFHCGRTERGCPHIPAPGLLLPGLLISREGLVNEVGSLQMLGVTYSSQSRGSHPKGR